MKAPKKFQRRIVQRLHPDGDAVDAGRAIIVKARLFDAVGIGFERDLGIRRHHPVFCNGIEDRAHRMTRHQGRGATAEENAADGRTRHAL